MNRLPISARLKLPFLVAGLRSFRYSVSLCFDVGAKTAGNSVGLGVPIHSLGTLLLTPVEAPAFRSRRKVRS
jgi:hypothetical protein